MYSLIQNVAKFRSKCEKYKMDFCPELTKKQTNKKQIFPGIDNFWVMFNQTRKLEKSSRREINSERICSSKEKGF